MVTIQTGLAEGDKSLVVTIKQNWLKVTRVQRSRYRQDWLKVTRVQRSRYKQDWLKETV